MHSHGAAPNKHTHTHTVIELEFIGNTPRSLSQKLYSVWSSASEFRKGQVPYLTGWGRQGQERLVGVHAFAHGTPFPLHSGVNYL